MVDSFDAPGCDVTFDGSGRFYVGGAGCGFPVTVYDAAHHLIAQSAGRELMDPQFGPNGEVFALAQSGDLVRLATVLPSTSAAP
ncbi:MAG: hypothetical protein QOE42_2821 [Chloroflexota bacterium]|nr:hypothetical protein [Chloroflexota bacterium]